MSEFSSYIAKLFWICAASLICELICKNTSDSKNSTFSAVKLICSLCICITVFSAFLPGSKILEDLENLTYTQENNEYDMFSENELIDNTRLTLETNISEAVFSSFGIKPTHVSIEFIIKRNSNITDVVISKADIILPEEASENLLVSVKNYAGETLGCDVIVRRDKNYE